MKSRALSIAVAAISAVVAAKGDESLVTNIYTAAYNVYADGNGNPTNSFYDALGGGIMNSSCNMSRFAAFCSLVSNRCDEVAADWMSYETNRLVRFTTQSAIAFSGFAAQTNFATTVLSLYEANTNSVSWDTIEMVLSPDGPADAENYLALHYDSPGVSNIIVRMREIAIQKNDNEMAEDCDSLLSGEQKREYLDMKAAGAL